MNTLKKKPMFIKISRNNFRMSIVSICLRPAMLIISMLMVLGFGINNSTVAQNFHYNFLSDKISKDSTTDNTGKSKVQKVKLGGLFISPNIGVSFPFGKSGDLSNTGFVYGAKFEIAYSRLYPFIFGFVYENQSNKGNAEFTTTNFLTQFDTKINYYGGSVDLILNKFIKSDFTIPLFSVEIKYASVSREVNPIQQLPPDVPTQESLIAYSAGLGFTIYVLDLSGKYTFAKDYSNLNFQMRIHIPVIKF